MISFMGQSWSEQKKSENHAKDILPRSSGDSEDIFCWRGGVVVLTQNETEFWLNKFHRLFTLNCFSLSLIVRKNLLMHALLSKSRYQGSIHDSLRRICWPKWWHRLPHAVMLVTKRITWVVLIEYSHKVFHCALPWQYLRLHLFQLLLPMEAQSFQKKMIRIMKFSER